jgi:hypothetical protein
MMKKIVVLFAMVMITLYACQVNKKIKKTEINNGINLDANHTSNNDFKLIHNAIDTISTTLIINKKTIEKSKVKSILDTIKMQNYKINIDKRKRTIELISI